MGFTEILWWFPGICSKFRIDFTWHVVSTWGSPGRTQAVAIDVVSWLPRGHSGCGRESHSAIGKCMENALKISEFQWEKSSRDQIPIWFVWRFDSRVFRSTEEISVTMDTLRSICVEYSTLGSRNHACPGLSRIDGGDWNSSRMFSVLLAYSSRPLVEDASVLTFWPFAMVVLLRL